MSWTGEHIVAHAIATIGSAPRTSLHPTSRHGRATSFAEKPQVTSGLVSGGFFACRREIFDYLDDRKDLVFENEPMRRLVAEGQLMVHEHDGFWQAMDTHLDDLLLNSLFESGRSQWVTW